MKVELFNFQRGAVVDLRVALESRRHVTTKALPSVISLQAPTGAGKTIIMSAFIEEAFFGSDYDTYGGDPDRIFVWLSDSPALNEQSKQKIQAKADKIKLNQCVTIEDESFDMEVLEEGYIYFLNTQKLGKSGNLVKHSDNRQYTIWETLDNTARTKADKLIVIIDEAHRGMQGNDAAKATTIMQRFLKGYEDKMRPMPFVIGMSATAERFQRLMHKITDRSSTNIVVSAEQVRSSGLLKDRIIISYPEDAEKTNPTIVLKQAAREWLDKCDSWYRYCHEQHYAQVYPIFVVQVESSKKNDEVSSTDLDAVLQTIETEYGGHFNEHEVVHTFGSIGTIPINGLKVEHILPEDIVNDPRIKVVFFKENLSTGWDCPRAEAMMSYRHAQDATYIAQLLGRMIRTPQQRHIEVDDSLNEVRLFLPYFNQETVQKVIDELLSSECGDVPADLEAESIGKRRFQKVSVLSAERSGSSQVQPSLFEEHDPKPQSSLVGQESSISAEQSESVLTDSPTATPPSAESKGRPAPKASSSENVDNNVTSRVKPSHAGRDILPPNRPPGNFLDRKAIVDFINQLALPCNYIKTTGNVDYLRLAADLTSILSQTGIYKEAEKLFKKSVAEKIHSYSLDLEASGIYSSRSDQLSKIKMLEAVFDSLGQPMPAEARTYSIFASGLLEVPAKRAENILGNAGIVNEYIRSYQDEKDYEDCLVDCILYANEKECMRNLGELSKKVFFDLHDKYRRYIVHLTDKERSKYDKIIRAGTVDISDLSFRLPDVMFCESNGGISYSDHLYVDEKGRFDAKLNDWERAVLDEERQRKDFVTWYRNQKGNAGLGMAYQREGKWRMFYPDFLIVRRDPGTQYAVDILEPHSPDFADNLPKAKAMAAFAEKAMTVVGRVEMIRQQKNSIGQRVFVRLNFASIAIREKLKQIRTHDDLSALFETDGIVEK